MKLGCILFFALLFFCNYAQEYVYYKSGINDGYSHACRLESEMNPPKEYFRIGTNDGFSFSCRLESEMVYRSAFQTGLNDGFHYTCRLESEMNYRLSFYKPGLNDGFSHACRLEGQMPIQAFYRSGVHDGFAYSCTGVVPLPIQFYNHTCHCTERGFLLSWEVPQETNSIHFTVLKSTDGVNYTSLESDVKVIEKSGFRFFYVIDENIAGQTTYYQVFGFQSNAEQEFLFECTGYCEQYLKDVFYFPNPVQNWLYITSTEQTITQVVIRNILGDIIIFANSNTQNFQIDLSVLNQGIYFVECTLDGHYRTSFKIVKN